MHPLYILVYIQYVFQLSPSVEHILVQTFWTFLAKSQGCANFLATSKLQVEGLLLFTWHQLEHSRSNPFKFESFRLGILVFNHKKCRHISYFQQPSCLLAQNYPMFSLAQLVIISCMIFFLVGFCTSSFCQSCKLKVAINH